ncbi:interleukin 21 receptor, tandem duplicate 1 [Tachysurus vachellii]|uniref:interleukin 21 receptor, tandem duplicate 1 n=1 Tax=Tachysurus vachellii TaxID=175792 RepID=UPI00296AE22A|nr:interleukin 21 receptor, tandem duplicate 1 [Tachysurus vachellii]
MMALFSSAVFLLVFCGLIHHTDGACNVSCTTDYISALNCSCSCSEKTLPCEVQANCSDEAGSSDGRCVIRPLQQWCTIQLDDFFMITNPDTTCTLKVKQLNLQSSREEYTSSRVMLLDQMIKPQQPVNLTLTNNNKEYNLSWDMAYKEQENVELFGYLMYRVRLRPKDTTEEGQLTVYNVKEDRRYQEIQCELLSPGMVYVFDVQASVNPQKKNLVGETAWSEWSESVVFTCPGPVPDFTWTSIPLLFVLTVPLLLLFVLGFSVMNKGLLKKSCLYQYIPDPHNFFKPLYHTYQGDFKKWVGPVFTFSSFDVLEKSAPLQVLSEKQLAAMPLQRPLLHDRGSGGSSLGDWSLLSLMNPDLSKRYFLGGSSLGLSHSGGHISMDTVTVSGQEGSMSDFHDNLRAVEVPDEAEDPEAGRREGLEGQGFEDWQLQDNDTENGEKLSLDSFSSTEHSDDGYPQIGLDLDTIDSGFLESDCSSPVSSECEGMDAALLGDTVGTHSNYVKQWVAFIPASGENSNSM